MSTIFMGLWIVALCILQIIFLKWQRAEKKVEQLRQAIYELKKIKEKGHKKEEED